MHHSGTTPSRTACTRPPPRARPGRAWPGPARPARSPPCSGPRPVRDDHAAEPPLALEHFLSSRACSVIGRAVDRVVGGHDQRRCPLRVTQASNGTRYSSRSTCSLIRRVVGPALGLGVVADEVLDRGRHPGRLQAGDEGDGHPGGQHRILGEALEPAAAQRRAHQVDGGRQQHVHALAAGLRAERGRELARPARCPRWRRVADGHGQAGRGMTLVLGDAPDPGGPVRHDHRPQAERGGAVGAPVVRAGQQAHLVRHGQRGEQGPLGRRSGAGRRRRAVDCAGGVLGVGRAAVIGGRARSCGHLPGRLPGRAGSAPHARYSCVELSSFPGTGRGYEAGLRCRTACSRYGLFGIGVM